MGGNNMNDEIKKEEEISVRVYCSKCHKTFYIPASKKGTAPCIYCGYDVIKIDKRSWDR
jgi:DNA-directed RNA polymerase subunit RPC12/RpoP